VGRDDRLRPPKSLHEWRTKGSRWRVSQQCAVVTMRVINCELTPVYQLGRDEEGLRFRRGAESWSSIVVGRQKRLFWVDRGRRSPATVPVRVKTPCRRPSLIFPLASSSGWRWRIRSRAPRCDRGRESGLSVRHYSHATAANRRHPDLITQRLVRVGLTGRPEPDQNNEGLSNAGSVRRLQSFFARLGVI
jgi:hypothetical protein